MEVCSGFNDSTNDNIFVLRGAFYYLVCLLWIEVFQYKTKINYDLMMIFKVEQKWNWQDSWGK